MENVLTKNYQIHFHEADCLGNARPVTLLNYMQDAAACHSDKFGYSLSYLQARNMTWVLSRYHIRVARYPKVGELIRVHTWRPALGGTFALRDFEVTDCNGNSLAVATSSWAIMNLETKRPVRIDTLITDFPINSRRALEDDFPSLPKLVKSDMEVPFKVRIADLDLNRHVNHTVYVVWALETVPQNFLHRLSPVEIEIGYRAEAFYGDTVLSRTSVARGEDPVQLTHQLLNNRDGRELTRLTTVWRQVA